MKKKLSFKTDDEFLKYIRVKTINSFNQKNMLIGVIEIKTDPKVQSKSGGKASLSSDSSSEG